MHFDDIIIPELLPPSEDGVFKTLLTHPEAKPVLRDVVESYMRFSVVDVVVRNVELAISDINEKRERFDVNCSIDDGGQCDIEMQSEAMKGDSLGSGHSVAKGRAIYHLCDLHAKQAGRGVRYDKLVQSFQMTFCGYTVFPENDKFVNRFSFRDEEGEELSEAVGIIFIELTKLGEALKRPVAAMTNDELWALFFAYAADPKRKDLLATMMRTKGEIRMAVDLLQTISKDEIERARFRSRRMFQMDLQHNLLASYDEGKAEGKSEGRTEERIEIARKLLETNMPTAQIVTITGITQEELEALRDKK
jgi:predicted transposase/invertase (TIGR01784 family)